MSKDVGFRSLQFTPGRKMFPPRAFQAGDREPENSGGILSVSDAKAGVCLTVKQIYRYAEAEGVVSWLSLDNRGSSRAPLRFLCVGHCLSYVAFSPTSTSKPRLKHDVGVPIKRVVDIVKILPQSVEASGDGIIPRGEILRRSAESEVATSRGRLQISARSN